MIDWAHGGRTTAFRYVRVAWPTMDELGEIEGVTGCEIEENDLTSLKVTGSLEYANLDDLGDDMVRIYSDSEVAGERETVCHGTLFVSTPSSTVTGEVRTGTADMYSALLAMQQTSPDQTYTADAGSNPVSLAQKLAENCGLKVVATPSGYTLSTSHSFDEESDSWLDIANYLLDVAGYTSVAVDSFGNAIMAPYVDLSSKTPACKMSDTEDDVTAGEFDHELDTYDVPNVVKVTCSNADDTPLVSIATNADPENPYSTVSRKKRIVRTETVSEIEGQAALDAKAAELLKSSMLVVEKIEIEHAWKPFRVGDAIDFDYRKSDMRVRLATVKRSTKMTPDIACTTTARRFVNLLEAT